MLWRSHSRCLGHLAMVAGLTTFAVAGASACEESSAASTGSASAAPAPEAVPATPPPQPAAKPAPTNAEPAPPPAATGQPSGGGEISDGELKTFAAAYKSAMSAREPYLKKMSEAQNQQQAMAVQSQVKEVVDKAIVASGMSIEAYARIAQLLDSDPALRQRLGAFIQ